MKFLSFFRCFGPVALTVSLGACAVGPAYERPATVSPATWREAVAAEGWVPAVPADALDRGPWWQLFGDATLNALAERVQVSNQNIAAAAAAYAQAQAAVREQRAALFPSASLNVNGSRSGTYSGGNDSNAVTGSLGASWAPDLWGRLSAGVSGAQAQAQASEADLAAARLSAIGALATNYFSLREADAELGTLDATIESYTRALTITRNRYAAAIAAQTDVLQAETTLANAQASRAVVQRSRETFEHAIAMLVGAAPADFHLARADSNWLPAVPDTPLALPSELLQRRPDIAAAERAVAAANAQIGIARAAYFPSLTLNASLSRSSTSLASLLDKSSTLWALGLSAAQVLFDAGAIGARVDEARASHEAAVAKYRQTTLAAFQAVEDQLSATASLAQQEKFLRTASAAADKTEAQVMNRYRAGQDSYTDVVTAQVSALSARRSLLQVQVQRQTTAVALIQALGGGWQADWMREVQANPPNSGSQ